MLRQTDCAEGHNTSNRVNRFENLGTPERVAAGAAAIGFGMSVFFLYLHGAVGNAGANGLELRAALEKVFVLFWPTAILLVGTHTLQGGIPLFLLSASLNAVYYVFVSLAAYIFHSKFSEKLEAFKVFIHSSNAGTPSIVRAAAFRAYQTPRIIQRISTRRPTL
jgi:hypothetical protein